MLSDLLDHNNTRTGLIEKYMIKVESKINNRIMHYKSIKNNIPMMYAQNNPLMKDSIKKIYESYISNDMSNASSNTSFDTMFNLLSDRIIEQSPNDIDDLLLLFSRGIDTKETENIIIFTKFFDHYATYLTLQPDKMLSVTVLKSLLGIIRNSDIKRLITPFIWSFQGFRDLIQFYPNSTNGFTAMSDSIFCTVTTKNLLIINIDDAMHSINPLIEDPRVHDALIMHINSILTHNNGYTYENPEMINESIVSTFDFCVLILCILIKIMKNTKHNLLSDDKLIDGMLTDDKLIDGMLTDDKLIDGKLSVLSSDQINERFGDIFWKAIDTVYITIYVMYDSINKTIHALQEYIRSLETNSGHESNNSAQILGARHHILKGNIMITRLSQYLSITDIKYIDTAIPKLIDHIINTKNFNTLSRLITCFGNRTIRSFQVDGIMIAEMILKILKSQNVPYHNKFLVMRFVMSHNLKHEMFLLKDSALIIIHYIINDTQRLKDLDKLHLIDVLLELSDTPIISSFDVLELYMYLASDFNEQYTVIIKELLFLPDIIKIDAIRNLNNIIESSALFLRNMSLLGRHSLSYLSDILSFVETICDTKNILKSYMEHSAYREFIYQNIVSEIFDNMRERYIEKIKPFVITLIRVLQIEYTVIIDTNSERIMKTVLNIDFDKELIKIKVVSSDTVPEDLMDIIKCDLAINPYYIRSGNPHNETLHIIDRKTVYNIYRSKIHPFTREHVDKNLIDEFNNMPHIKQLRDNALQKINSL